MKIQKVQLVTLLLLLHPAATISQVKPAAVPQRVPKKIPHSEATKYLTEPFDITSSHLRPGFKGHDIAAIWKAIASAEAPRAKSEFETSSQYAERKARFGHMVLAGTVSGDDYLAFSVAPRYFGDADPDEPLGGGFSFGYYDADKEIFKFTLVGSQYLGKDSIAIRSVVVGRRNYTASNAFGAKIQVSETDSLKYGLAFEPLSWIFPEAHAYLSGHLGDFRLFERTISMAPEKAQRFLPNAEVVLICKLAQDQWSLSSQGGQTPTLDSPESTNIEKHYIQVKPEQIWILDASSGEVIKKFSQSSNASDTAAAPLEKSPLVNFSKTAAAPLKKSPLVVQLSMQSERVDRLQGLVFVTADDEKEEMALFKDNVSVFYADKKIRLRWLVPTDLSRLLLSVNGQPYVPLWQKTMKGPLISEASAVITIGN